MSHPETDVEKRLFSPQPSKKSGRSLASVLPRLESEVKQRLFSAREVSVIMGRSLASVWRDVKAGRLVAVRICGSTRITAESIEALCQSSGPSIKGGNVRTIRKGSQASAAKRLRAATE
jgi:hypothetical protein